jgi:hypothetical protein
MESGICYSHESPEIMPMRVLFIALEDSESCNEISLLEEMCHIWEFVFLLL